MKNPPLVYVNIIIWRDGRWIRKCMDTVIDSRYPNFKVLVINNNSVDNGANIVKEYYSQVEIIDNRKNMGFAEGHNIGIRYALAQNADFIVLLNPDTSVDSLWLDELVEVAETKKEFALLTPLNYDYSEKKFDPHILSRILLHCNGFRDDYEKGLKLKRIYEHNCSLGAALFVRRDVFLKVGLIDPFYFIYHEEADFLQRCFYHGFRMALVTTTKICHRHGLLHPDEMPIKNRYRSMRNIFVIKLKNIDTPIIKNIFSCLGWTINEVFRNKSSFSGLKGLIKSTFILFLQLFVIIYLPMIIYKRYNEKRKPCYLNAGNVVNNRCPVCHRITHFKILREKGFTLNKCLNCDIVITSPQPSDELIARIYKKDYFLQLVRNEKLQIDENTKRMKIIGKYMHLGKKILDVGCGTGLFLSQVSSGNKIFGVEISSDAVEIARKRSGGKIYLGELESINFDDENFDIITLIHTLEHVKNPVNVIKECRRILKPDGIIIIETPNRNFLFRLPFGYGRPSPVEHLFQFNPQNIKKLLENLNFRVIEVNFLKPTLSRGLRNSLEYLIRKIAYLISRIITVNITDNILLIAKK
ncbi:MAG: methyltransferase domain-containing protein [Elusimicrobiota bacterium]